MEQENILCEIIPDYNIRLYSENSILHVTIGSPFSLEHRHNWDVIVFTDFTTKHTTSLEKCACRIKVDKFQRQVQVAGNDQLYFKL